MNDESTETTHGVIAIAFTTVSIDRRAIDTIRIPGGGGDLTILSSSFFANVPLMLEPR